MSGLCRFLFGALCLVAAPAQAQEGGHGMDAHQGLDAQRHHPSQDQPLHETFYSKWHMPDNPSASCCRRRQPGHSAGGLDPQPVMTVPMPFGCAIKIQSVNQHLFNLTAQHGDG